LIPRLLVKEPDCSFLGDDDVVLPHR
jgi:hypothetical protein